MINVVAHQPQVGFHYVMALVNCVLARNFPTKPPVAFPEANPVTAVVDYGQTLDVKLTGHFQVTLETRQVEGAPPTTDNRFVTIEPVGASGEFLKVGYCARVAGEDKPKTYQNNRIGPHDMMAESITITKFLMAGLPEGAVQ